MSIKPGYKQTEVGVIPEEWEVSLIGHQCQIFGRIGFRGYTVDDIVEEGSGAIAINPSNVQDGKTIFNKCTYISWHKYEESPEIKIDEGDIILVKTGSTFGKTAMVKNLPGKATLNPQVIVFKKVKGSRDFFGYMMGFPTIQKQITAAVVGGALPTLSQKLIAAFKMPLPRILPEQRAIAQALSDVDALIASLEKLIAKKRDLKQAAMQQLLTGQTRLPGFEGKGYKQTEVGVIPEEWQMVPLGVFVKITSGASPSLFHFSGGGIPYFKVEQLSNAEKYLDATDTPYLFESGDTVPEQSLIFAKRGAAIALNKVRILKRASFIDTNLMALLPLDGLDCEYLYYALGHIGLWRFADTTSVPQINNKHIKPLPFPLPPLPEQRAIAQILTDMDAELVALEQRRDKTKALKQGMMQELLTGRTRLV